MSQLESRLLNDSNSPRLPLPRFIEPEPGLLHITQMVLRVHLGFTLRQRASEHENDQLADLCLRKVGARCVTSLKHAETNANDEADDKHRT